jgi:plastocyanin
MRERFLAWWIPLLLAVMFVAAACQGGGGVGTQNVTVAGSEFKFEPPTVTVKANQPVQVTFRNTGTTTHDWTVDLPSGRVHAVAEAGRTTTVTFTPAAGTYRVHCEQPGHSEAGMVGQLIVQ